jgi:hypothetical protein
VFGRNVVAILILMDGGEVVLDIAFAWVFLFTKLIVSL